MLGKVNKLDNINKLKKKRKPITSCAFCRQRKLKCDQERPICTTCKTRKLTKCIYTEDLDHAIETKILFDKTPNIELLLRIKDLEKELESIKKYQSLANVIDIEEGNFSSRYHSFLTHGDNIEEDRRQGRARNVLSNFQFLEVKSSGQSVSFGPTAIQTYLNINGRGFSEKFNELWNKVQAERQKFGRNAYIPSKRELKLLEGEFNSNKTLLANAINELPCFEKCKELLEMFFNPVNCEIYGMAKTLDRNKTLNDFYTYFKPGESSEAGIKLCFLLTDTENNYYKVGVIFMILAITFYRGRLPSAIEAFIIFITGFITENVCFLERAQFLLLRYNYIQLFGMEEEDLDLITLTDLLISCTKSLGLDGDTSNYKNIIGYSGNISAIENLRCQIVLIDFQTSFKFGKLPCLTSITFEDKYMNCAQENESKSEISQRKTMRFLRMAMPMLYEICSAYGVPNLKTYFSAVTHFINKEFLPMSYFTNDVLIDHVSIDDISLLGNCLSLLITFCSLRFAVFKERNTELKIHTLHIALLSFAMMTAVTSKCFRMDKRQFYSMFTKGSKDVTPYMSLSVPLLKGMFHRNMSVFCAMLYFKLTIFDSKLLIFKSDENSKWDLDTIERKHVDDVSLVAAFRKFCEIFDSWTKQEDSQFKEIMSRSKFHITAVAMEKTYRTILSKVLEYRALAEDSWILQAEQDIYASPYEPVQKDKQCQAEKQIRKHENKPAAISYVSEPIENPVQWHVDALHDSTSVLNQDKIRENEAIRTNSSIVNSSYEQAGCESLMLNQDPDFVQSITDGFWANYNTAWEDLLKSNDLHYFFSDL